MGNAKCWGKSDGPKKLSVRGVEGKKWRGRKLGSHGHPWIAQRAFCRGFSACPKGPPLGPGLKGCLPVTADLSKLGVWQWQRSPLKIIPIISIFIAEAFLNDHLSSPGRLKRPLAGKANKKSNHDFPTNHSGCSSVFRLKGSAPVLSGRHLGVAVEGAEVLEGDGAVEVADGHPVEESELSVDAPHRRRGPLAGGEPATGGVFCFGGDSQPFKEKSGRRSPNEGSDSDRKPGCSKPQTQHRQRWVGMCFG